MAISFVGANAAASTSVSLPTHQAGDLIIVGAFRDGSTTSPTLGSGFTNLNNSGGSTCSIRVGYKIAASSSETSGTWSNASGVAVSVYRGASSVGNFSVQGGSSTTITYPAVTLNRTDNTSWVVRFAGHRTATNLGTNTPTGFTERAVVASEVKISDSNGTVSSQSSGTQSVNASSGWRAISLEITEPGPPFSTFTDNFDDGTLSANWENWGGANVNETGGQLQIGSGTAADSYNGIDATSPHNLTGESVSMQVVEAGTQAAAYGLYPIQVTSGADALYWYINNGTAYGYKVVGGTYTSVGSTTHTDGNYYRIRESSGTTYWEYSADGENWTSINSQANPTAVVEMGVSIFTELTSASTARIAKLDNFNLLPTPSVSSNIAKVVGITEANIATVLGVAKASIASVMGVDN